mmetsp:Transcript_24231/g.78151  ORF Transcript_24231/g.78151 Transcript_24231/m.78151 type:complete len:208 (-) Transcript_24231:123-746(-)
MAAALAAREMPSPRDPQGALSTGQDAGDAPAPRSKSLARTAISSGVAFHGTRTDSGVAANAPRRSRVTTISSLSSSPSRLGQLDAKDRPPDVHRTVAAPRERRRRRRRGTGSPHLAPSASSNTQRHDTRHDTSLTSRRAVGGRQAATSRRKARRRRGERGDNSCPCLRLSIGTTSDASRPYKLRQKKKAITEQREDARVASPSLALR